MHICLFSNEKLEISGSILQHGSYFLNILFFLGSWKIGACGQPLYGTKSRVDKVNKELCYKGDIFHLFHFHIPVLFPVPFSPFHYLLSFSLILHVVALHRRDITLKNHISSLLCNTPSPQII